MSQRLVTGADGKRCAAIEIMVNTLHIADLISRGPINELKEAMSDSDAKGMQTFDVSSYELYVEGRIAPDEALNDADSRTNLEAKINFGSGMPLTPNWRFLE